MESSPTISIITVTYNAARWIEQTIRSVASQTYLNIEYIIVDGASADQTLNIIKDNSPLVQAGLRSSTFHYQLLSEPDQGIYDAMNKGLAKATGDYVWFINAGDMIYSSDTIRTMIDALAAADQIPDILYGETGIIDAQGESVGMRRLKAPEVLTWKSFRMGMLVCHQSFIVKRTLAPGFDLQYRFSSDVDWCIRCMKKAKTIHNTHLILSKFLETGTTTANQKASLKERFRIMCRYYGTIPTIIRHVWFAVRFFILKKPAMGKI